SPGRAPPPARGRAKGRGAGAASFQGSEERRRVFDLLRREKGLAAVLGRYAVQPFDAPVRRHDRVGLDARGVGEAQANLLQREPRADAGEGGTDIAGGPLRPRNHMAEKTAAIALCEHYLAPPLGIAGEGEGGEGEEGQQTLHPRPTKGILVAMMVMNCTLVSSGRLAM